MFFAITQERKGRGEFMHALKFTIPYGCTTVILFFTRKLLDYGCRTQACRTRDGHTCTACTRSAALEFQERVVRLTHWFDGVTLFQYR